MIKVDLQYGTDKSSKIFQVLGSHTKLEGLKCLCVECSFGLLSGRLCFKSAAAVRIRLPRGAKPPNFYSSKVLSVSQSVRGGQKLQNHDLGFGCGINTEQDLERMLLQWVNTEAKEVVE